MNYRDEETYHLFENSGGTDGKQEFEFKDAYWDEMESMLDAHDSKKRKRRAAFLWFSSSAMMLLIFFGLYQFGVFTGKQDLNFKFNAEIDVIREAPVSQNIESIQDENLNTPKASHNLKDAKKVLDQSTLNSKSTNSVVAAKKSSNNSTPTKKIVNPALKNAEEFANQLESHNQELAQLKTEVISEDAKLEKANALSAKEIANNYSAGFILEKRKAKFPLKHSLFLNAEGGIVNNYSANGISYGLTAGLGYELGFHKNLAFQTGVNIQYREGLSQSYENSTKVYGFSSSRYYQEVNYKGQLNVEIPVALRVKLRRSSITAGVGTSFLVGVRSTVQQYLPESENVENISNNFGIKEGIRNMDVNLHLQYAYAITPNIELSAGVSAGLLDQTSNDFFENDKKDHNLRFQMGLKYFFWNK